MRLRLLLSFALVVLVSVASVVLVARQNAVTEVGQFMFAGGMSNAQDLVSSLENYYQDHGSWQGVDSLFVNLEQGMGMGGMMGQWLRLTDASGNLLVDTAAQPVGKLGMADLAQATPLHSGQSVVGYLLAQSAMGFNLGDQSRLVSRLSSGALTAGLVGGGVSLLLALLLAYGLARPVNALTRAAGRLAEGDLSHRVAVRGKGELADLARSFNHMADSLERAETGRRAMTADIAHELRNPLAVQRAHLEALQDGVYPLAPGSLQPILDQNLLLTRLVEDLRTLALAESGQLRLERAPTELPALVEQVAARFVPQVEARRIQMSVSGINQEGVSVPISIDPGRVEQILSNLLSNALRYTPDGGSIDLFLNRSGNSLQVTLRDSGPGIPTEALPHIFERFYRADRSRSRTEGGTGLGLAIARQLAEAQGGTLTATNNPQGGAAFTLTLPVTQVIAREPKLSSEASNENK